MRNLWFQAMSVLLLKLNRRYAGYCVLLATLDEGSVNYARVDMQLKIIQTQINLAVALRGKK